MRPAATDLATIYAQQQGLTQDQAEAATAVAMMELLYETTLYISPGLGSFPQNPAIDQAYRPNYPILADPQS